MSANFFSLRKTKLQKLEEIDFSKIKEEVKEEIKEVVVEKTKFIGKKVIDSTKQLRFEKWLDAEYKKEFASVSNDAETEETKDPFHYETSLKEDDVNNWEALQKAIKEMGLRETYCRGVYCEQHSPNMPAGNYTQQRHYVWNDATQEMVELPEIYYLSDDGGEAEGLEGYEEIQAYTQGFRFTETDGIYTKDGKNYRFNSETVSFEEIEEPVDTRTGLEKLWDKYQTDENDKEVTVEKLIPFLDDLGAVLMSDEYNYTKEEVQSIVQKALEKCPLHNTNSGLTLATINLKEFVTVVRNIIEGNEEPEKSPADKILDKYDTEEYDKDVAGIDAVATLQEIMDELKPVLQNEYNMTDQDISELLKKALKEALKTNLAYGSTINVRTFVNTLRELIANFEPQVEEPKNPVITEIFGDKEELNVHDFYTELDKLTNSSIEEVSQFAKKINEIYSKFYILNDYDGEDLVKSILKIVNNKLGIENTAPMVLTKDWLNKLFENDVLSVLDDILNNSVDEVKREYYCGVDGVIDTFSQGSMGDCWLLGGLISIANNENGKQILKDAIKQNDDNSITITFKKPAASYTISAETMIETRQNRGYSKGDNDVLAMELAVSMLINDLKNGKYSDTSWDNGSTVENGGHSAFIFRILTGKSSSFISGGEQYDRVELLEEMYKFYKDSTLILNASTGSSPKSVTTIDGKLVELVGPHAYGVSNMTENTITLINPWNSSEEFTITYEEFAKSFHEIDFCDLNSREELPKIDTNHKININGIDYTVDNILNSEKELFTNFDITSIQYAGEVNRTVNNVEMKNSIKSILDNILSGFNADNYTDYNKLKKAYDATLFYFNAIVDITTRDIEKTFRYASVGYIEVNEHAPMIKSDNDEDFDEVNDFGNTENNGILIGYNTDTNMFKIHIDVKAVLQKFLSFVQ